MAVVVRRATRDDANEIAKLAMKLVEQHVGYDPVRFARLATLEGMAGFYGGQTDADDAAVVVAELEGEIIGFAYVGYEKRSYEDLAENSAWIHDIYIDEAARGAGAGKALIEAAREFAKELAATKLMLSVAAKNLAAQSFFKQVGFETTMHEMMLVVGD